jgi:DNA (cytosine-5)-methyltransferase 1
VRPRLLDLFCGAGGCTKGYQQAGFRVVGVDIKPQPNYCGDDFVQLDALAVLLDLASDGTTHARGFDAVHSSPPCQFATAYKRTGNVKESPNLILATRTLLIASGLPYVIENVENARSELRDPVMLCGSGFGLDVQRHRLFETNFPLMSPGCSHGQWAADRFPGGRSKGRTGSSQGLVRGTVEVGSWDIPLDVQQRAMDIDWMTLPELSQAIPPAYCEHIGHYLLAAVNARQAA